MIDAIRDYMRTCPLVDSRMRVGVDYLGSKPKQFVIEVTPSDPIIQTYADGGTIRQVNFIFASRDYYGQDILQSLDNNGFYADLSEWIENQNKAGNLPLLDDDKQAISIETLTNGYLLSADDDTARYQVQMKLKYYKDN